MSKKKTSIQLSWIKLFLLFREKNLDLTCTALKNHENTALNVYFTTSSSQSKWMTSVPFAKKRITYIEHRT
jgi:hypothetical protein